MLCALISESRKKISHIYIKKKLWEMVKLLELLGCEPKLLQELPAHHTAGNSDGSRFSLSHTHTVMLYLYASVKQNR